MDATAARERSHRDTWESEKKCETHMTSHVPNVSHLEKYG